MFQDIQNHYSVGEPVGQGAFQEIKLKQRNVREFFGDGAEHFLEGIRPDESSVGESLTQQLKCIPGGAPDLDDSRLRLSKPFSERPGGVPPRSDVHIVILTAVVVEQMIEIVGPAFGLNVVGQNTPGDFTDLEDGSRPLWCL